MLKFWNALWNNSLFGLILTLAVCLPLVIGGLLFLVAIIPSSWSAEHLHLIFFIYFGGIMMFLLTLNQFIDWSTKGKIDHNKWSFNPETGEYHRIIFKSSSGNLIRKETHHERWTERLKVIEKLRPFGFGALVSGAVLAACWWALSGARPDYDPMGGVLTVVCAFSGIGFLGSVVFWLTLVFFQLEEVGPEPVPLPKATPQAIDDFKNQNTFGKARIATPWEIHAALSRKSAPVARRFED